MVVLVLVVGWEKLRPMEVCGAVGGPVVYVTSTVTHSCAVFMINTVRRLTSTLGTIEYTWAGKSLCGSTTAG